MLAPEASCDCLMPKVSWSDGNVYKAPNPVDKYVGSRVRMRRIMLGMSQEKLGEALGLTFQQIQKYEKGTNRVGASRIQQIAEILQVPVSFLFEGGPSGAANARRLRRRRLALLCLGFPRDLRRSRADQRVHPNHRFEDAPLDRRSRRADRRPRRSRQTLTRRSIRFENFVNLAYAVICAARFCARLCDDAVQRHMTTIQSVRSPNDSRWHPPLGGDRDPDGSA